MQTHTHTCILIQYYIYDISIQSGFPSIYPNYCSHFLDMSELASHLTVEAGALGKFVDLQDWPGPAAGPRPQLPWVLLPLRGQWTPLNHPTVEAL